MVLVPFIGKAVHLDDTVFIYVAKQISQHPGDPFGLMINWYGHQMPLHEVQQNGPLASYYMALAASLLGWSERALHLAFLLPAAASALGMYYLAERLSSQSILATLMMVFSPVFIVSGTTLMCDVMMLALWLWAVVLWIGSIDRSSHGLAMGSAILIGAAIVTKYYAAAIVPLLLAYSILRWKEVGWRILYLLIPVAMTLAYDATMIRLYGHSLLQAAGDHALRVGGVESSGWYRMAVGLSFTGGCIASILFYAPLLCSRWVFGAICLLCGLVAFITSYGLELNIGEGESVTSALALALNAQFAVFLIGGAGLLTLAVKDVYESRDADACLLGLWVAGTFVFCSLLNWTINGRSLLPMVPPASLVIIRALRPTFLVASRVNQVIKLIPLGLTVVLALCVAWADSWWANSARTAALAIDSQPQFHSQRERLYFTGHWGFQYYMDALGYQSFDRIDSTLRLGDLLVFPENNTNVPKSLLMNASQVDEMTFPVHPFATTMRAEAGAGFYSSQLGHLPFALGRFSAERYWIMTVTGTDLARFRVEQLEQKVQENPNSAEAFHHLAVVLSTINCMEQAIDNFEIAVQLDATNVAILNDYAWVLATMPSRGVSHGPKALMLAQQAHALAGGQSAGLLDTLAVALAANQRFDEAISTARQALDLLKDDANKDLSQQVADRLQLYMQQRPFYETYPDTALPP